MKRIFTKKWWIFLSSIPVVGGIVYACAGGDWPEYGTSNFTPEAFVEKKYSPFFFSPSSYYYGIGHDNEQVDRFSGINITDWATYLDNKQVNAELGFLLQDASKNTIDSIAAFLNSKTTVLPLSVQGYALLKDKRDKKVKAFINYLSLAKEAAVFAATTADWWDYESRKPVVYKDAPAFNKAVQAGFSNAADPFLKQRYWFQLVRSEFFNGEQQAAIDLFEQQQNTFRHDPLFYRTMSYAAGAYYRQKNYSKANYYYSLVYDACDELKTTAHYSFHPQEESDWNATLALARSNEEKVTLWQMLGIFYGDEKRSIREIYKLVPSSDKLNLLLARAVNKEEQKLNAEYEGFDVNKIAGLAIDKELLALVLSIANEEKANDPFMWHSATAYLQMLDHQYKLADQYLSKAEKTAHNEELKKWQLRLLKVLNKVAGSATIDTKTEDAILADVEWLRTYTEGEKNVFRHADAFTFIKAVMAKKYRKQSDRVKSECYVSRSLFYTDDRNVEAMKSFLLKNNVSAYEKLCRNLYDKTLDDLFQYQGVRLAYQDKVDMAIAALEQSGEKMKLELAGNPFNGKIKDCFECDHASYKGVPYTKLSLLKKMKEMEGNLQAGNDVFNNAILLGNAFYNISYYGNARDFYVSSIAGSFQYTSNSLDSAFKSFLLNMDVARTCYAKALAGATTGEQKAKCHYMLAKCDRNDWYTRNIYNSNDYYGGDMVDLRSISNFKMLKQYSDTKYYQDVIRECGYFRSYLKME